jgi:hypothetical protein
MKAMQRVPGAWDRIATREELCQVFDLLENIPTAQSLDRSEPAVASLTLAGSEGAIAPRDLWLDRSGEEPLEDQLDSNLESLAELIAGRDGFVN